ncbi:tyrosine-type recombinase/integrase [Pseudoroseomonas sp. WGS1072]|uniref:tyrosine-type recombinase/integrase n=1 Tax=Roseomonas sp. WGS1072 TaxID=3366816 RepID=UPI003BF061E5
MNMTVSQVVGGKASLPAGRTSRRIALTDRRLDDWATKRLIKPVDLSDTTVRGLSARIHPSGRRTFYMRWRVGDVFHRVRLDAATVAEARQKAVEAKAAIAIGRDPRATKAAHGPATALTVSEAIQTYTEDELLIRRNRDARYVENVRRLFRNHVEPHIGHLRLIDLGHADLSRLFTLLVKGTSAKARGEVVGPSADRQRRSKRPIDGRAKRVSVMPNRVHAQIMGLLRWAEEDGRLPPGVTPKIRKPIRIEPSLRRLQQGTKRVLDLAHLAGLWLAVEDEPDHIRSLIRLLLLLPLRRQEVTGLEWNEVLGLTSTTTTMDNTMFSGPRLDISATRMKGNRPHLVPLPPLATDLLKAMAQRRGNAGPYVFSTTAGRTPFAGWQSLVVRLRRRCPELPAGWTIHDFRTAIATAMGERLDVDEMLIARLLAHSIEAKIGITWRYDRSRRIKPMLDVLVKWEGLLLDAVEQQKHHGRLKGGQC